MSNILFKGIRKENIYILSMHVNSHEHCLVVSLYDSHLWHRRCDHINVKNILRISKNNLVSGLPKLDFKKNHFCDPCQ